MNFYTIYLYIMLLGQYASIIIGQWNLVNETILQIVKMLQEQEQKHTLQWKYNTAVVFFRGNKIILQAKIIMPSYIIQ